MILTDTHTHLYYEKDPDKLKLLIDRCVENGVTRLFLPNVNSESVEEVKALTHLYPEYCYPMLGLHPCDVKENYLDELDRIKRAMEEMKIWAVGEIGIDLYWDKTTLAVQQEAFRTQIGWAKERDLPIVIHCRDAFDEVYEILLEQRDEKLKGIFHCFTGTKEQADRITDLGFYLGIGGVLTYKNSGLDKVVAQLDMKHLVLETDSPYLTPVPFRGKPNESSYLVYIAAKLAEIKNVDLETVAEITTRNSKSIFGI
ncbi:TatD family hydrolase [Arcticibacter sp. MXS-1]|uniref:TatD family hydrolase n=1 Tax=Arcticibacter sp. MXS-1 TaxID=3341726 RepID=UPI0035A97551